MLVEIMKPVGGDHKVGDTIDAAHFVHQDILVRSGHIRPVSTDSATAHAAKEIAQLTARLEAAEARSKAQEEQIAELRRERKGKGNA